MATRQSTDTRAKDSDRNDTCQVLDTALSEGQLSMEEHRQRVSAVTTAMRHARVTTPECSPPRGTEYIEAILLTEVLKRRNG